MEPAVFLDRDNTLIANDGDLGDPDSVTLIAGVPEGLKALREAGFRLVVVTNQGGVARGRYTENDVDAVHQRIAQLVETTADGQTLIDRFYYCPYHPDGKIENYRREHPWRKPNPGMLLQAARDMQLDLAQSWMIGNEPRDIEAGRKAGCRTVLVHAHETVSREALPTACAHSFAEAVEIILRSSDHQSNGVRTSAPAIAPRTPRVDPAVRDAGARQPSSAHTTPPPIQSTDAIKQLQHSLREFIDELRSERRMRSEFTPLRMAAGTLQLLVVLLALLGIMHVAQLDSFLKWMTGAVLLQLTTIALLLVDARR